MVVRADLPGDQGLQAIVTGRQDIGLEREQEIHVRLSADPTAASAARRMLETLSDRLPTQAMEDLQLLLSEVVTNTVRHAGLRPADTLDVLIRIGAAWILVEVKDRGKGFTIHPPKPRSDGAGGWGLYLVDRLASRWGVRSGPETSVWFELDMAG